jgi:polyhydroxyalkanoate synthase
MQSMGNPWLQWHQSWMDQGIANLQRLSKISGLYEKAQRVKKGATPSEVVYRDDRLSLLHYPTDQPAKYKTPLIFVFALVNRPYILDLKPGRSVVSHFVDHGFDTFLVDWGSPTPSDHKLTLDDYVNGYLDRVVDYVCEHTGADQVSILGYCMGGTMSAMYTALHPEKVKNLMLLAAGIDFSTREGLLNVWTQPDVFDVDKFIDAFGNCPAEYLQGSFLMLKPVQNLLEKPINFFENLENDKFVEDFLTLETWLNDNIAVPGEVFRSFVKHLYQKNLLVQNRMPVGERIVSLKDITCPVLNIMASADDLVPCAQSQPFNDLVGSSDRKSITLKAGHIGLAIGGKAQREVWPPACEWLAKRS